MEREKHYINRSGWLRVVVLGGNDGILSTASLVIGIAAATELRGPIVLAAVAGVVAGSLSMAAGEYVSVSSQLDIETADLKREQKELDTMPDVELKELAKLYEHRGLDSHLAAQVAIQLTKHNVLGAHAKDELGIGDNSKAKPLQASLASGISFLGGGALPLLVGLLAPIKNMILWQYCFSIVFLAVLGAVSAKAGGSSMAKSILRICFWSTIAMGVTAFIGYSFGGKN
jgi:vacuolar iron transporter family protein